MHCRRSTWPIEAQSPQRRSPPALSPEAARLTLLSDAPPPLCSSLLSKYRAKVAFLALGLHCAAIRSRRRIVFQLILPHNIALVSTCFAALITALYTPPHVKALALAHVRIVFTRRLHALWERWLLERARARKLMLGAAHFAHIARGQCIAAWAIRATELAYLAARCASRRALALQVRPPSGWDRPCTLCLSTRAPSHLPGSKRFRSPFLGTFLPDPKRSRSTIIASRSVANSHFWRL